MKDYRVLVIGPRRGLIEILRQRRIPFSLWQQNATFKTSASELNVVAPLWGSPAKIREQVRKSFPNQRFTHVIAGTESSVVPAAIARRLVGARLASAATSKLCRDKLLMKEHLAGFGIPMTRYRADSADLDPRALFAELGTPIVRKYRKSSGGRGLQILTSPEEFVPGKQGVSIVERFVDAPEASVESFINGGKVEFVNLTDYHSKGHSNFVPAMFDEGVSKTLLEFNERVIAALGITWGMTHLEVYRTENGPLFGEIAMRPPGGYIMNAMAHAWGFNPWEAFLAMELGEDFEFPSSLCTFAASEVLHPGVGRVVAVRGKSQVLAEQGVQEFRLKVKSGQQLRERNTLGQDTGYVVHASTTPEEPLALHEFIQSTLIIELEA